MTLLGIKYFFHDSTACVVMDGKLAAAIEEERLTRQKHTGASSSPAAIGLLPRDVRYRLRGGGR